MNAAKTGFVAGCLCSAAITALAMMQSATSVDERSVDSGSRPASQSLAVSTDSAETSRSPTATAVQSVDAAAMPNVRQQPDSDIESVVAEQPANAPGTDSPLPSLARPPRQRLARELTTQQPPDSDSPTSSASSAAQTIARRQPVSAASELSQQTANVDVDEQPAQPRLTQERFWGPFHARIRAQSLADYLGKIVAHPMQVVADNDGYHIAYQYRQDSERNRLREKIANAGLTLK